MTATRVQLEQPIDAIIFDCDGTLSAIEGIDELARMNNVGAPVAALTSIAMGTTGINPTIYQQRLALVKPTITQVQAVGHDYYQHQMPDAHAVIRIFQKLHKPVFLVSAGLLPAVKIFGEQLEIPAAHIFAVQVEFDVLGNYVSFDHESPLTQADGKRRIVSRILKDFPRIAYVGDGLNDLAVYDLATRFIGMGGAYFRQVIEDKCDFYIREKTLAPLLPLVLTASEAKNLASADELFYACGLQAIMNHGVKIS